MSEVRFRGRFVFGGTQTSETPYVVARQDGRIVSLTPRGDSSGSIEREVSDGIVMQVNVPGREIFEGSLNSFDVLIDLRDALLTNDVGKVRSSLTGVADMREKISTVRGTVGARVNRMELTRNILDRVTIEMSAVLSADEDVDLTSTIVNLQQGQDVFQAALASGNAVIPQSLMDFLR